MQRTSWLAVFEILNTMESTQAPTIFTTLPEPLELFLFGVVLIAAVVVLRWALNREGGETKEEEFSKENVTKEA